MTDITNNLIDTAGFFTELDVLVDCVDSEIEQIRGFAPADREKIAKTQVLVSLVAQKLNEFSKEYQKIINKL